MKLEKNLKKISISRDTVFEILIDIISKKLLKLILNTSINPNQVTFFGAVIALYGIVSYFILQNNFVLTLSLIIYLICDFLDGDLARAKNCYSNFGFALDKYVDKLILISILIIIINFNILTSSSYVLSKLIFTLSILYFQILLILNSNFKFRKSSRDFVKRKDKISQLLNRYIRPTHINIILYFLIFNWLNLIEWYIFIFGIISFVLIFKQFINLKKI